MGLNSVQKPDKISGAIFDKDYLMDTFRNTNEVKSLAKKPVQNYTNRDVEIMTLTFGGIKDLGFVKYDNLSKTWKDLFKRGGDYSRCIYYRLGHRSYFRRNIWRQCAFAGFIHMPVLFSQQVYLQRKLSFGIRIFVCCDGSF